MTAGRLVLLVPLALLTALVVDELWLRATDPFGYAVVEDRERFSREVFAPDPPYWPLALRAGAESTLLGTRVVIGSHRLRNRETVQSRPGDVFRVLVLGDSVAFGWGVEEPDCFPRLLEEQLNRTGGLSGRKVEVINAGVPGWAPHDQYLWLKEKGLRLQPDLVVQALTGNDFPAWKSPEDVAAPAPAQPRREPSPLDRSWALRHLRGLLQRTPPEYFTGVKATPLGILVVCRALEATRELCGSRPYFVMDTAGVEELAPCCRGAGAHYVPALLPAERYRERFAVAPNDDHPNRAGHLLLAEMLLKGIRAQVR